MSPLADGALWHQGEGWEGESKGPCPTQGARVLISGPGRDTGLQSVGHGCCVQDGQASASSQASLRGMSSLWRHLCSLGENLPGCGVCWAWWGGEVPS